jgi:pimeloyl-ACP methyl ester carboxylesterase
MNEVRLDAGHITLAALDNEGAGPIVLGLHGYLDNAESLRGLAPYLKGFRFIALDLAGHGHSEHRPLGCHYNQADYLQDLHGLIERQQWPHVILIGHSMGGILASLYASLFPEKVVSVISIDACGPLTLDATTTQQQMRDAIVSRHGKEFIKRRKVNLEDAVTARCRVSDIAPNHARSILSRNIVQELDGDCYWCSDAKVRTKSIVRLTENQAENLMQAINCPILFIGASNSFKRLEDAFARRRSWFKNAQYEAFDGGHHIHMEKSDEIGTLIQRFVGQM